MPKADSTKKTSRAAKPKARKPAKKSGTTVKRPLSAYMFFSQDWRERIKTENPDASFGEIGKLLGAKWKEMTGEEKKPYMEQAAKDKERAEKEREAQDTKAHEEEEKEEDADQDDDDD